jgi:hypothetical protein
MFSPVETQVIFLSKETTIVSVCLRTAGGTLHESKQNGVKIEVGQMVYRTNDGLITSHLYRLSLA